MVNLEFEMLESLTVIGDPHFLLLISATNQIEVYTSTFVKNNVDCSH